MTNGGSAVRALEQALRSRDPSAQIEALERLATDAPPSGEGLRGILQMVCALTRICSGPVLSSSSLLQALHVMTTAPVDPSHKSMLHEVVQTIVNRSLQEGPAKGAAAAELFSPLLPVPGQCGILSTLLQKGCATDGLLRQVESLAVQAGGERLVFALEQGIEEACAQPECLCNALPMARLLTSLRPDDGRYRELLAHSLLLNRQTTEVLSVLSDGENSPEADLTEACAVFQEGRYAEAKTMPTCLPQSLPGLRISLVSLKCVTPCQNV